MRLEKELECLTGKIFRGDITEYLIEMFKQSEDKEELLKFKAYCSDKNLIDEIERRLRVAKNKKDVTDTIEDSCGRLSVERWFSN